MSRFLLLLIFLAWMSWGAHPGSLLDSPVHVDIVQTTEFLAGYVVLVLITAYFCRRLAQRVDGLNLNRTLKRFNRLMSQARLAVLLWFVVGVYFLGWGALVNGYLAHLGLRPDHFDSPGLVAGCMPAMLAWMALWWAQYPADIAFREQGLLAQLDSGLPIHRPPAFLSYFFANLRLQLLFTVVPVITLIGLRDGLSLALAPFGLNEQDSVYLQLGISLTTAAVVLLFAPEMLKRLLHTEPMGDSPLRQRLESVCRRHNIRYKNILLWRTDHNMGNAAVMGLIAPVRYILMSDLLLETMTDEQIEAVFAHEVGHIIHRHMLWFGVFFGAMMFALVGLTEPVGRLLDRWTPAAQWVSAAGSMAAGLGCLVLFLYLSRKFERQADVFAARTIQEEQPADINSHVGEYGATVFSSALHQVARINCIPLTAWSWCHGSIAHRIDYLKDLSHDPRRTVKFDRTMSRLYAVLILALCAFGVWAMVTIAGQRGG
jgi:STE24 endopeptidase